MIFRALTKRGANTIEILALYFGTELNLSKKLTSWKSARLQPIVKVIPQCLAVSTSFAATVNQIGYLLRNSRYAGVRFMWAC